LSRAAEFVIDGYDDDHEHSRCKHDAAAVFCRLLLLLMVMMIMQRMKILMSVVAEGDEAIVQYALEAVRYRSCH